MMNPETGLRRRRLTEGGAVSVGLLTLLLTTLSCSDGGDPAPTAPAHESHAPPAASQAEPAGHAAPADEHAGHAAPADPHAGHTLPSDEHAGHAMPAGGAVEVSAEAVSALGIRAEPARSGEVATKVRGPATVSWDPLTVVLVSAQAGGQVRTLSVPRPGEGVRQGQVLARLYQPELRAAFAELLVAQNLGEPWQGAARARLAALGVSASEVEAALSSGSAPETTAVRAPTGGVVLERAVSEGAWIGPGGQVAIIGDTEALVVEATVSGAPPAPGASVTLRDPATGQTWPATVSSTLPTASAAGLQVRLRPEGGVPVGRPLVAEWQSTVTGGVWVPRTALVDTGERRVVFVELAPGRYAPRSVEVGARAGDQVQVLSGLAAGEPVVVAGTFLLDSETQIGALGHAGHGG